MSSEHYNTDDPPTLFVAGTRRGKAIGLDTSTIRPCGGVFVGRSKPSIANGNDGELIAVKLIPDDKSREPRNGRREAELLAKISHPNIVELLNSYLEPKSIALMNPRLTLFTPYYPYTLRQLLDSPSFVPEHFPSFARLSDSIARQLLSATAYLHERKISYRDINPSNIVLTQDGRPILIDFGIAVEFDEEEPGSQHFEVGTGPYRAPELVFASRSYDSAAIDLWALAATISELFRPFASTAVSSPSSTSEEDDSYHEFEDRSSRDPPAPRRQSLFTSGASDFVLSASIFKVLGTPTLDSWPEAKDLPNFSRFSFVSFPPTSLKDHLPYLDTSSSVLEILQAMLVCSASKRMSAKEALRRLGTDQSDFRIDLATIMEK